MFLAQAQLSDMFTDFVCMEALSRESTFNHRQVGHLRLWQQLMG